MKDKGQYYNQKTSGSIHLLLAGHSTGHILKVIEAFRPSHLDLFTSVELQTSVSEFMSSTEQFHGTYHIETIPSFTENSLISGISIILGRYNVVKTKFPLKRIYFGITGGTNTMAVEIAISALFSGESMHYVVKNANDEGDLGKIIMFDMEELSIFLKTVNAGRIE